MKVPSKEIESRLENLRGELRKRKLGGFFASSRDDVHYLSGFTGDDSYLLITQKKQMLLTDRRFTEEAEQSAPLFEAILWQKHPSLFAGDLARKARIRSVGFNAGHLSFALHAEMRKSAKGVKLESAEDIIRDMRAIKSNWEVKQLQAALVCAEDSFRAFKKKVSPGMSETDLRLELEWEMRRRGASDAAFELIVAADANASLPHAHAGGRKVRKGGLLLVDFGAKVGGYNSDLTRVVFLDTILSQWRKRYELVLAAQAAGIAAIGPGVKGCDADAAARNVFKAEGCDDKFGHSLGHGIGLAVHEQPIVSLRSQKILMPGMVVTAEPGLYYPKQGGIRIEDMVLVTSTGRKVLSRLEKDLESAVV